MGKLVTLLKMVVYISLLQNGLNKAVRFNRTKVFHNGLGTVQNVFSQGAMSKDQRVLFAQANLTTEPDRVVILYGFSADENLPFLNIVQPHDKFEHCAFPRSSFSTYTNERASFNLKGSVF